MKIEKGTPAIVVKNLIEAGVDIKSAIVYLESILHRPHDENDRFERIKRSQTDKFLYLLKEVEKEYPWALITQETTLKTEATLTNIRKLLRLMGHNEA